MYVVQGTCTYRRDRYHIVFHALSGQLMAAVINANTQNG